MKLAMENMTQVRAFAKHMLGTVALVLISTSYITQVDAQSIKSINNIANHRLGRSLMQAPNPTVVKPQNRGGE